MKSIRENNKIQHIQIFFFIFLFMSLIVIVFAQSCNQEHHGKMQQITVRREPGQFFGWPANGGIWNWGDEILVQYDHGEFKDKPIGSHDINDDKPIVIDQSRSLDGGLTWTHETTTIYNTEEGDPPKNVPSLTTSIDFSDPNTILKFEWAGYLYYSTDRGRNWNGPYKLPNFGCERISLRTDYLVDDSHTCMAFWPIACNNNSQTEAFVVKTTDGGLSWTKGARISRKAGGSGKKIDGAGMPSTVRISSTKLVSCIRNLIAYPKVPWIDCMKSTDNGATWKKISQPVGNEAGTTPPALTRLKNGKLVLTYGYRKPLKGPTSIRAKISVDDGKTWGEEIILRNGGGDEDIGYTRNALRPDGKMVTSYYWQEDEKEERYIAATIWDPGKY